MRTENKIPSLYKELSPWWHLFSPPEDYDEEADFFKTNFLEYSSQPPKTLLELGSSGGNNASFLKKDFQITLVDISPGMLEVSRKLNPEYIVEFAILLHESGKETQFKYDRHVFGLFKRDVWLKLLRVVGFESKVVHDSFNRELFIGTKPKN